jgi:hypothetical protein
VTVLKLFTCHRDNVTAHSSVGPAGMPLVRTFSLTIATNTYFQRTLAIALSVGTSLVYAEQPCSETKNILYFGVVRTAEGSATPFNSLQV